MFWASTVACTPSTGGLGESSETLADEDTAQTDTTEDGESTSDGTTTDGPDATEDESTDGTETDSTTGDTTETETDSTTDTGDTTDTTDTGPEMCTVHEVGVFIDLAGDGVNPDKCDEIEFEGVVKAAQVDNFDLSVCECGMPCEMPAGRTLVVTQPDIAWNLPLELETCYEFRLFSESTGPATCKYNRIDILMPGDNKPTFSTGAASEDYNESGFRAEPVDADICEDDCSTWQYKHVEFTVMGETVVVPLGDEGVLQTNEDHYELAAWPSWQHEPAGDCAPDVPPVVTSWSARRTGP